jgi:hypothetical protein
MVHLCETNIDEFPLKSSYNFGEKKWISKKTTMIMICQKEKEYETHKCNKSRLLTDSGPNPEDARSTTN